MNAKLSNKHLLIYLKMHGIRDVILAMGYHPDTIERGREAVMRHMMGAVDIRI